MVFVIVYSCCSHTSTLNECLQTEQALMIPTGYRTIDF